MSTTPPLELETPSSHPTQLARVVPIVDNANRDERIDVRIAAGEIPPRPAGEHFAAWYDAHVGCTTPGHRYFIRERGERVCAACLGA